MFESSHTHLPSIWRSSSPVHADAAKYGTGTTSITVIYSKCMVVECKLKIVIDRNNNCLQKILIKNCTCLCKLKMISFIIQYRSICIWIINLNYMCFVILYLLCHQTDTKDYSFLIRYSYLKLILLLKKRYLHNKWMVRHSYPWYHFEVSTYINI